MHFLCIILMLKVASKFSIITFIIKHRKKLTNAMYGLSIRAGEMHGYGFPHKFPTDYRKTQQNLWYGESLGN